MFTRRVWEQLQTENYVGDRCDEFAPYVHILHARFLISSTCTRFVFVVCFCFFFSFRLSLYLFQVNGQEFTLIRINSNSKCYFCWFHRKCCTLSNCGTTAHLCGNLNGVWLTKSVVGKWLYGISIDLSMCRNIWFMNEITFIQ